MGLWDFFRQRRAAPSPALGALPLFFKDADAALQFACSIAPAVRPGILVPAVIDDVERAGDFGPVARVRIASPEGPRSLIAAFPDKDDLIGATARIGDLCAVLVNRDKPPPGVPDLLLVAAILAPEFDTKQMAWREIKRLGTGGN